MGTPDTMSDSDESIDIQITQVSSKEEMTKETAKAEDSDESIDVQLTQVSYTDEMAKEKKKGNLFLRSCRVTSKMSKQAYKRRRQRVIGQLPERLISREWSSFVQHANRYEQSITS